MNDGRGLLRRRAVVGAVCAIALVALSPTIRVPQRYIALAAATALAVGALVMVVVSRRITRAPSATRVRHGAPTPAGRLLHYQLVVVSLLPAAAFLVFFVLSLIRRHYVFALIFLPFVVLYVFLVPRRIARLRRLSVASRIRDEGAHGSGETT